MSIIRNANFDDLQVFSSQEAIKYGIEIAIILGNIEKYPQVHSSLLHFKFPYIEYVKFYESMNKAIHLGLLEIEGEE